MTYFVIWCYRENKINFKGGVPHHKDNGRGNTECIVGSSAVYD